MSTADLALNSQFSDLFGDSKSNGGIGAGPCIFANGSFNKFLVLFLEVLIVLFEVV